MENCTSPVEIYIAGINYDSLVDGEGVRVSIFVSGCNRHCKGCFNERAWDFTYGRLLDEDLMQKILEAVERPYISGVTIVGGEPMDHENVRGVFDLLNRILTHCRIKNLRRNVWVYSGYSFEELLHRCESHDVLLHTDVLVDGPFEEILRNVTLPFRGSSNQRIIDVKKSIAQDKVVLWTPRGE